MPTIDDANKRLSELTAQISTLIRSISLGVLAIVWLFLSGSSEVSHISSIPKWELIFIALLSIISISFDLLQYVMGYRGVSVARDLAKQSESKQVTYPNNFYRRTRFFFFYAKIFVTVVTAGWLVYVLAVAVFSQQPA